MKVGSEENVCRAMNGSEVTTSIKKKKEKKKEESKEKKKETDVHAVLFAIISK